MHKLTLLFATILLSPFLLSAQSAWQELSPDSPQLPGGEQLIVPQKHRTFRLDRNSMQAILANAPVADGPVSGAVEMPGIELPVPDGGMYRFRMVETPVMTPALQARYPQIRCYTGYGTGPAGHWKVKLDLTPQGLHAMVFTPQATYFIDPMYRESDEFYIVYDKKDYTNPEKTDSWSCEVEENVQEQPGSGRSPVGPAARPRPSRSSSETVELRRYRLAVTCTGEYSQFHGGTIPLALAAVSTTMHRVNGVYERDFAVTMQLIANNDEIVFLDGDTDPFEEQSLAESQLVIDSIIGSPNYDVGHLFRRGGGGVANLQSPCNDSRKARGLTGLNQPIGDPFDIDYVSHEFGHQFAGLHTFNHCGSPVSGAAAVEPGSGTTIMAYAGICGADNVASNSQDIFHGYNITEMNSFIIDGGGDSCPEKLATENHPPQVDAGAAYTIPRSTPFHLTATGSDPDGDTLTYTWEQMDFGLADSPPTPTSAAGPLFRSYKGSTSPTRVFPRLEDLVNNIDADWEELPGLARLLNFRVTARDNNWQTGGVALDDTRVTVADNSGPFRVLMPDTNLIWQAGETQAISWDVANTTAAPVSCENVRIRLSTDGGYTYPIVLLSATPNDGSASVQVPDQVSDNCRIRVEGLGNIFFDISNEDFRIIPAESPIFLMSASATELEACAGTTPSLELNFEPLLGFDSLVEVTVSGGPAAMTTELSAASTSPDGSLTATFDNLQSEDAGTYLLQVEGSAGSITRTLTLPLHILPGMPLPAELPVPADGSLNLPTSVPLAWNTPYAETHFLQVATNPSFEPGAVVYASAPATSADTLTGLSPATVYYWRARGANSCAEQPFGKSFAFQTVEIDCGYEFTSTDVPAAISPNSLDTAFSSLAIPLERRINDLRVSMNISHTWVGDLSARLISPGSDTLMLFDRPGHPASTYGCDQDNLSLAFDQQASQSAEELETLCNPGPLALSGTFTPVDDFTALTGDSVQGNWTLYVTDAYNADGGAINGWGIDCCLTAELPILSGLEKDTLYVPVAGSRALSPAQLQLSLQGSDSTARYILLKAPLHGMLLKSGAPLTVGSSFTQKDIELGQIVYTHNASGELKDQFRFDAFDPARSHWLHDEPLEIVMLENLVSAGAVSHPASCAGSADGSITISVAGGAPPYEVEGSTFESTITLDSLVAGEYSLTISDAAGFEFTLSAEVDEPTPLNVNAALSGSLIVAVAAGGTPPYTYSLNGGPEQPGGTFSELPPGNYAVQVTDANGCTAVAEELEVISSVIDPQQAWGLRIAPNPGDGHFILCMEGAPAQLQAELFDAAGQRLRSYRFQPTGSTFSTTLDLSDLPKAAYLLHLSDGRRHGAVWLNIIE